jgi:hypothetical protein
MPTINDPADRFRAEGYPAPAKESFYNWRRPSGVCDVSSIFAGQKKSNPPAKMNHSPHCNQRAGDDRTLLIMARFQANLRRGRRQVRSTNNTVEQRGHNAVMAEVIGSLSDAIAAALKPYRVDSVAKMKTAQHFTCKTR